MCVCVCVYNLLYRSVLFASLCKCFLARHHCTPA